MLLTQGIPLSLSQPLSDFLKTFLKVLAYFDAEILTTSKTIKYDCLNIGKSVRRICVNLGRKC
jgi:hypothetical protein